MNVNVSIKEYIAGNYDLFQCLSITVSTDRDSNVRLNVSQQPVRGTVFNSHLQSTPSFQVKLVTISKR